MLFFNSSSRKVWCSWILRLQMSIFLSQLHLRTAAGSGFSFRDTDTNTKVNFIWKRLLAPWQISLHWVFRICLEKQGTNRIENTNKNAKVNCTWELVVKVAPPSLSCLHPPLHLKLKCSAVNCILKKIHSPHSAVRFTVQQCSCTRVCNSVELPPLPPPQLSPSSNNLAGP